MLTKVILVGNLGKDPEVRHFENGGSLARFSLATSETYTRKEKWRKSNANRMAQCGNTWWTSRKSSRALY